MTRKSRPLVSSQQKHRPKTAPEVSKKVMAQNGSLSSKATWPNLMHLSLDSSDDDSNDEPPSVRRSTSGKASEERLREPLTLVAYRHLPYIMEELNGKSIRVARGSDIEKLV